MQLEEIVQRIEDAFGAAPPMASSALVATDVAILQRLNEDSGYQIYMQDQYSRQIIRDFLTNAVILGVLSEGELASFSAQVATEEGRSRLSLHMLMSSVEEAGSLVDDGVDTVLQPLQPVPDSPPHMKLVP